MTQQMIVGPIARIAIQNNGLTVPMYFYPNDRIGYVRADIGDEIAIQITPIVSGRVLAIVSVDGRSTMENVPADYMTNSGMVITGPWLCEGYEIGGGNISRFTVTYPANSEAAWNTGSTANVGSIGVALYQEYVPPRPRPQPMQQVYSLGGDDTLETLRGEAKSPVAMEGGRNEYRPTGKTTFRRRTDQPAQISIIQYRPLWWLQQHGLITQPDNRPNPFPQNTTGYEHLRRRR